MKLAALAIAALLPALAVAAPVEEVPFVVSPDNVTLAMLQLAKVGPEDYVIDLGSGDGRIVLTAAKRFGARGLGVEIVPELVAKSREAAHNMHLEQRAHFRELDLFKADLSPASVITMYLLPEVNLQLRPRLLQLRSGTRIVSHDWDMGEWEPDKTITLDVPDKAVGREKTSKVHLWIVPARVEGDWCGTGKHKGVELRLAQAFQKYRAQLTDAKGVKEFEGRIHGDVLRGPQGLNLTFDGVHVRATWAAGKYSAIRNATFARSRGQTCK
ncbi:MAG: methyltransferase domain-containing protein [Usitatibacter sp.]